MPLSSDAAASNHTIDTILSRRSVREGLGARPVSHSDLEVILRCGLSAPSSKNARPWRFHVLQTLPLRAALAAAAAGAEGVDDYVPHDPRTGDAYPYWSSTVLESIDVLRAAPTAIAIENRGVFSGNRATLMEANRPALLASLTAYGFESMGLGAALENMWLAANSLGISAAFLGDLAIARDHAKSLLGCEGDLMGILALGYADALPRPRREPPPETQTSSPIVWH